MGHISRDFSIFGSLFPGCQRPQGLFFLKKTTFGFSSPYFPGANARRGFFFRKNSTSQQFFSKQCPHCRGSGGFGRELVVRLHCHLAVLASKKSGKPVCLTNIFFTKQAIENAGFCHRRAVRHPKSTENNIFSMFFMISSIL